MVGTVVVSFTPTVSFSISFVILASNSTKLVEGAVVLTAGAITRDSFFLFITFLGSFASGASFGSVGSFASGASNSSFTSVDSFASVGSFAAFGSVASFGSVDSFGSFASDLVSRLVTGLISLVMGCTAV